MSSLSDTSGNVDLLEYLGLNESITQESPTDPGACPESVESDSCALTAWLSAPESVESSCALTAWLSEQMAQPQVAPPAPAAGASNGNAGQAPSSSLDSMFGWDALSKMYCDNGNESSQSQPMNGPGGVNGNGTKSSQPQPDIFEILESTVPAAAATAAVATAAASTVSPGPIAASSTASAPGPNPGHGNSNPGAAAAAMSMVQDAYDYWANTANNWPDHGYGPAGSYGKGQKGKNHSGSYANGNNNGWHPNAYYSGTYGPYNSGGKGNGCSQGPFPHWYRDQSHHGEYQNGGKTGGEYQNGGKTGGKRSYLNGPNSYSKHRFQDCTNPNYIAVGGLPNGRPSDWKIDGDKSKIQPDGLPFGEHHSTFEGDRSGAHGSWIASTPKSLKFHDRCHRNGLLPGLSQTARGDTYFGHIPSKNHGRDTSRNAFVPDATAFPDCCVKFFLGGLHFSTTDEDLFAYFGKFGPKLQEGLDGNLVPVENQKMLSNQNPGPGASGPGLQVPGPLLFDNTDSKPIRAWTKAWPNEPTAPDQPCVIGEKSSPIKFCEVRRDPFSGRSRYFGFVCFKRTEDAKNCYLAGPHRVGGRYIEVKPKTGGTGGPVGGRKRDSDNSQGYYPNPRTIKGGAAAFGSATNDWAGLNCSNGVNQTGGPGFFTSGATAAAALSAVQNQPDLQCQASQDSSGSSAGSESENQQLHAQQRLSQNCGRVSETKRPNIATDTFILPAQIPFIGTPGQSSTSALNPTTSLKLSSMTSCSESTADTGLTGRMTQNSNSLNGRLTLNSNNSNNSQQLDLSGSDDQMLLTQKSLNLELGPGGRNSDGGKTLGAGAGGRDGGEKTLEAGAGGQSGLEKVFHEDELSL